MCGTNAGYRLALLLIVLNALFGESLGQVRQPPGLKPVPMNPGPLGSAGYITLLPIDDRPAGGQFAQMVGAIADHKVLMPPRDLLGRFTSPADTARIETWLKAQDYSKNDAIVVSVDMLAYGGLVASRAHQTGFDAARKRLEFFRWFKSKYPRIPIYAFSTIMRLAPTATGATHGQPAGLARWAELKDRVEKERDDKLRAEFDRLQSSIDPGEIEGYLAARKRNLQINLLLLDLYKGGTINELIFLQDDARLFGLHRQDQAALKKRLDEMGLEGGIQMHNGADEGAISLVSRAVLDKFAQKLRVGVIYPSEKSREAIAPFEDHPLQATVESQIRAAGGIPVGEFEPSDYTLFVNAPGATDEEFGLFLKKFIKSLKEARYIALADLLFPVPHHCGADERIISALRHEGLLDRLASFAAWNTAGNTLGTAIPAANMRVFFKTKLNDSVERAARAEAAHLAFLLHRYAGDYLYHDLVRQEINERLGLEAKIDPLPQQKTDAISLEIAEKLGALLDRFFDAHFRNRSYTLAYYNNQKRSIMPTGLKELKIYLPWPRTFEVAVEYKLEYTVQ